MSEQDDNASTRFIPLMLLPEPFPIASGSFGFSFPSKEISIAGSEYLSDILDATIPIIP
jgi:hypothetical protein